MPRTREASAMARTLLDAALSDVWHDARWATIGIQPGFQPRFDVLERQSRHDLLDYVAQLELRCEEMAQQLAPRIPSLKEWR